MIYLPVMVHSTSLRRYTVAMMLHGSSENGEARIKNIYYMHAQSTQKEALGAGGLWTHLSLWQAHSPVSGLVAWFLHGAWASPCPCCLVTVRCRLWFMQTGRWSLVGQLRYVVRPTLGQSTKASQQKQWGRISNQERGNLESYLIINYRLSNFRKIDDLEYVF